MTAGQPTPVLEFENVTVSFGDVVALDSVSFTAREGESRIVLGAAGSGKTVILKASLGLVRPDSGFVRVFGRDITAMAERDLFEIRGRIGMLFQESALFDSLTVEENVAYPLLNQKSICCPPEDVLPRVTEALEFVGLGGALEKSPSELSGGMRRRAAIARAVVTAPPLVLYDSPTAGLDPITAHTIMALIVKERDMAGATSLLVTHRYQDGALMANFRYNPEQGRLAPAGAAAGLLPPTVFMVMREGRLVFEGGQSALEASRDSYVLQFVKRRN